MNWLFSRTKGDLVIWVIVMILSVFSLLAVYSSTSTMAYKYQNGNTEYYLLKHLFLMAFGLVMMYGCHQINYKYYSRISQILIWITPFLLILTYFAGTNINQASRWLTLPGTNLSFQTSDFAKLALIMYTARMLSKKQEIINDFWKATVPIIAPALVVCILIAPANLSTALVLFSTCVLLMFIGRVNLKHLFSILGSAFTILVLFITISYQLGGVARVNTWVNRIDTFINGGDADESYQSQQAKIAIAVGGVLGKGAGNSVQKNFLPNPYSDYIFATIVEEYGSLGGVVLILLYLLLLYRSIRIVMRSPRAFGALLAAGLSFSLVLQALINMGVAVGIFPVTGLTLPLVSMGGTSLWFTSIAFGIILSVSRDIEENEDLEEVAIA
jgi:cell division protein FtsW